MITQNTKTMTYPNVLIVDDEIITSEFVRLILERYDINITGVADTPKKALQIFSEGKTDLIICDIDLRNGMSGIDFIRHVKQLRPTHVIYLTGFTDEETLKNALKTQPDAYITKPFTHNQLIATLMTVVNETKFNKKMDVGPVPTKRELQIIENLARGMTSYQIASTMNISFETVQTYRKRILNKFGVNSSSEIIVMAMKNRWINLSYSDPTLF